MATRRLLLALALAVLPSALSAQTTDRERRQRADWALARLDDAARDLYAARSHVGWWSGVSALDPTVQALATARARVQAMRDSLHARITADSLAARSPAPPPDTATPAPAPQPGALAVHDFDDGTLGPFVAGTNGDVAVVADPTGSGRGHVVRIRYARGSTGQSPDVNRAFRWEPAGGFGLGETLRFRGDVYLPQPQAGMEGAQRKLFYAQKRNRSTNPGSDFLFVKLEGFSGGGQRLKVEVRQGGAKNQVFTASAVVTFDRWHALEVELRGNSAVGVADGVLRVWLDGVLVIDRTDRAFHSAPSPFDRFLVGQQVQHLYGDRSVIFDEVRYWDRIEFRGS